jgi:hypothetical protein
MITWSPARKQSNLAILSLILGRLTSDQALRHCRDLRQSQQRQIVRPKQRWQQCQRLQRWQRSEQWRKWKRTPRIPICRTLRFPAPSHFTNIVAIFRGLALRSIAKPLSFRQSSKMLSTKSRFVLVAGRSLGQRNVAARPVNRVMAPVQSTRPALPTIKRSKAQRRAVLIATEFLRSLNAVKSRLVWYTGVTDVLNPLLFR